MKHIEIVPSVLSSEVDDYISLAKAYKKFSKTVHIDIMDGDYTQTASPDVFEILKHMKNINIDIFIHLMVKNPLPVLEKLLELHPETLKRIKLVYVHVETAPRNIVFYSYPFKIGFAVSPDITIKQCLPALERSGIGLFMTVEPGKQGNPFIPERLLFIDELRKKGYTGEIHLDGHITDETAELVLQHQPDLLTLGSYITKSYAPELSFRKMENLIHQHLKLSR